MGVSLGMRLQFIVVMCWTRVDSLIPSSHSLNLGMGLQQRYAKAMCAVHYSRGQILPIQDYDKHSIVLKVTCRLKTCQHHFFTLLWSRWRLIELHLATSIIMAENSLDTEWIGRLKVRYFCGNESHYARFLLLTQISLLVEQPIQVYQGIPSWLPPLYIWQRSQPFKNLG